MLPNLKFSDKVLINIGNSFLISFLIINIFNTLPFKFNNFSWLQNCTMVLVDTGSFILLGLSALFYVNKKNLSFIDKNINSILDKSKKSLNEILNEDESDTRKILLQINRNKNIYLRAIKKLKKISLFSISLYLIVIILQFYIVIKGVNFYDYNYTNNVENINKQFQLFVEKNPNNKNIDLERIKKNDLNKSFEKANNTQRFLLFKNSFRIILLSIIWLIAIFKIKNF